MKLSLLVTTYNRGPLMAEAMQSWARFTQPDEVIVVNDGGEDDCSVLLGNYSVRTGTRCAYHYLDNPLTTVPSKARNHGLRHCAGDLILLSEPEVVFRDDIVARFREAREARAGWFTTEEIDLAPEGDPLNTDPAVCTHHTPGEVPAYISMYDRADLERLGGWDEDFPAPWGGEDTDLQCRLEEIGVERHAVPGAAAVHLHHPRNTTQRTMTFAWANHMHQFRKPYTHGDPDHICSDECLRARGVIV